MNATITLPETLYQRLALKSKQMERSPEVLLADLVQQYLDDAESQWQARFETLLARVQARNSAYSAAEIEADITAAADEVKAIRRARRSG
jgi:predicted DNA-binding protein